MANQFDELINSFIENKVGIDHLFLSESLSKGLLENLLQLTHDDLLVSAGTGSKQSVHHEQAMRGDKIYWMDKSHNNEHECAFLLLIEELIQYLNSTCYTSINAYEFHYALYEKGAGYKKHKDQFSDNNNRKFSFINYLNTGWLEEDGGQLLIYNEGTVQRIQPQLQTAVFFKSNEMEHEVALSNRSRMSITGWLKSV